MAKMKLNPLFAGISGKIGNIVIKRSPNGDVIVARTPDLSRVKPSQAQLDQRRAFGKASDYAKFALADEALRAFYETRAQLRNITPRAVCVGDYLNAPTLEDLDFSQYHGQVGDRIRITTHDDVGVVKVNVKLTRIDGRLIENGQASEQRAGSGNWEYVATVPVPLGTDIFISAQAFDRPGNRTVASVNPIVGESH
jgi:hypothetical protein